MIKFCEKGRFRHDKLSFDANSLLLTFHDERYKKGSIGYVHHQLNLSQLEAVQLMYEFPDQEKRRQEAEAKTNQNRAENAIIGGVIGGGIDMLIGDDDSILDGVLAGAALGAAVTPVEKIDLTEQKEHYLLMLFKNGDSYKLLVDASGLADVLRALHKARKQHADEPAKDPVIKVPLSEDELRIAAQAAKENYINDNKIVSFLMMIALLAAAVLFGAYWLFDAFLAFMSSVAAAHGDSVPREPMSMTAIIIAAGIGVAWIVATIIVGGYEGKKAQEAIAQGEGKPKVINKSLVAAQA